MSKMNPEIKARWVAALRSGEYRQTRGALRKDAGFCCLGVLCDLRDPAGWTSHEVGSGFSYSTNTGMPPEAVREWAGFERAHYGDWFRTPKVEIDGTLLDVDEHNDQGRTFAEIADAIEDQL